jgi:undecaprenyl diphosphate synthase
VALTSEEFASRLSSVEAGGRRRAGPAPDVDLLIRSGGEQRLSDFLLWESAYAELVFTPTMWPDFGAGDLERAVSEFRHRDRRFGGLPRRAAS